MAGASVRIDYAANDSDPDGRDDLSESVTLTSPPQAGTAEPLGPAFLYTPASGFVGDDAFTYQLCAGSDPASCDSATVTVDVLQEAPEPPTITVEVEDVVVERPGPSSSRAQCDPRWGGHENGKVPPSELQAISKDHHLEPVAARAFLEMRDDAADKNVPLSVTDSYRSYDEQVAVRRRKGHLVATALPGTSVHGWGKALDLNTKAPRVQTWLQRHSARYGWVNPAWAKRPGKSFEPWHYEFCPTGGAQASKVGRERAMLSLGALLAAFLAASIVTRDVARGRRATGLPSRGFR